MGEGDFWPHTTPRPWTDFHETWTITTSRTRPCMQNFGGLCRRGWPGQIASLAHESFCHFFLSSSRPQVASLDTSLHTICHYTSFPPTNCLLMIWYLICSNTHHIETNKYIQWARQTRVRKMKFEIWPLSPLPSNNVKIGTLSWRSMENCSRPNSGTVSHIQFKLGTGIDHPSGVTWYDFSVKNSKVKVRTSRNVSG